MLLRPDTTAEGHLQESTELLKSVFGGYEKPSFEKCIDCLDDQASETLRAAWAKSLWEFGPEELDYFYRHYYCGSFTSPEQREDFSRTTKYWLPRLLYDLSASWADNFICERLLWAKWLQWPSEEVEAVKGWFATWLRACIAFDHVTADTQGSWSPRWAPTCLDYAMQIGLDLTFVLYDIATDLAPHDVHAIRDIVTAFAPEVIRREKLDDDSNAKATMLRAILKWMLHPATNERLERAFFRCAEDDRELARKLSETSEWVEIIRQSYSADPRGKPNWLLVFRVH